jgi:hypothetical protein
MAVAKAQGFYMVELITIIKSSVVQGPDVNVLKLFAFLTDANGKLSLNICPWQAF